MLMNSIVSVFILQNCYFALE